MARNEHNFNVNLNAPRPWWVAFIGSIFSWLFDFFDDEGRLSVGKTVVKGFIFLLLISQAWRCSDWTKEVRGIDPNLRTDGYFTMNWQHRESRRYAMPGASLFVVHEERTYEKLDNGVMYIYPSDFHHEIEYPILPGACQMLIRGQRGRFSSHSPPWYVRGMKVEVIYDPPRFLSFLRAKRSWSNLAGENDWWAIPVSKGGYRQFIAQARDDENGLICVPDKIIN